MIIFLGAGASSVFGIPTMHGFIPLFDKEVGESELYTEVKKAFSPIDLEVVMTILEDLTSTEEEFFDKVSPQTAKFFFKKTKDEVHKYVTDIKIKDEAKSLITKLKRIIRVECGKAIRENTSKILEVYDAFFKALHNLNQALQFWDSGAVSYPLDLKIITTNYDTCFETYLNRRQIEFTRGIVPRYGYNVHDVDSYDDTGNKVGIFKLHGSVDLFRKEENIRQLPAIGGNLTYLGEEYGEEVLRWPVEFSGYKNIIESPYLDLFRLFRERIKHDRFWILIGSSFRDRTVCSIMNDVLRLKHITEFPKIIYVDPKAKQVINRLKNQGFNYLTDLMSPIEQKFGSEAYLSKLNVTG